METGSWMPLSAVRAYSLQFSYEWVHAILCLYHIVNFVALSGKAINGTFLLS